MTMADRPYELAPTDELLEEILLRYDHAAFIGMKCGVRHGDDTHLFCRRYTGNTMTIMGLCFDMAIAAHNSFEQKPTSGDEEGASGEDDDE